MLEEKTEKQKIIFNMENMGMKILVVVDMQSGFNSDPPLSERVIRNCQKLINRSKKNGDKIILLEYKTFGKTIYALKKLVKEYPDVYTLFKYSMSGGNTIHNFLSKKRIGVKKIKRINVCGCYTNACVYETTRSLLREGYPITVYKNACFCDNSDIWWRYHSLQSQLSKQEQLAIKRVS